MTIKYINAEAPALLFGPAEGFTMGKSEFFNIMSDPSSDLKPSQRITRAALKDIYGDNGATDARRYRWYLKDAIRLYLMQGNPVGMPEEPLSDDLSDVIGPVYRNFTISQDGGKGAEVTLSLTAANCTRIQWFTQTAEDAPKVPIEGATGETLVITAAQVAASYGPYISVTLYNDNRKTMVELPPVLGDGATYDRTVR